MPHLIQAAGAAQPRAARAAHAVGPAHPLTRLLLAAAALAAAAAWEAGHRVTDLHLPRQLTRKGALMNALEFRTAHGDPTTWSTADFESYEHLSTTAAALHRTRRRRGTEEDHPRAGRDHTPPARG
jgi:hypothetical protein